MCAALVPSDDEVAVCSAYLKHRGVNGTIIFAMLSGSQAYNLAHANSDKDYLGSLHVLLMHLSFCCQLVLTHVASLLLGRNLHGRQ
jgi:hypothetical protein